MSKDDSSTSHRSGPDSAPSNPTHETIEIQDCLDSTEEKKETPIPHHTTTNTHENSNDPNDPSKDYLYDICPEGGYTALQQIIDSGFPLESVHETV